MSLLPLLPYKTLRTIQLTQIHLTPGDELRLSLHNEERDQGIYALIKRVHDVFFVSFDFFPTAVLLHPAHLAILVEQGRGNRLDVTITEAKAKDWREYVDLTTLPTSTPLLADSSLDLFTAVATYQFYLEDAGTMALDAMTFLLKHYEK